MGIQAFAVATTINLITGQRLCRRLHSEYRELVDMPTEALLEEGFTEEMIAQGVKVFQPVLGHEDCPSGYKGRAGIYQVMPISDTMKRLIIEGANAVGLADQAAAEGIWDIRRAGLQKIISGITSLAEVNRVTVE
jgi:type IV pilus assembly protein PilB